MYGTQIAAVTTAEEWNPRAPNGLSMVGEPQEEPEAAFYIGRQLWNPPEAPQTVPSVDACPRQTPYSCGSRR